MSAAHRRALLPPAIAAALSLAVVELLVRPLFTPRGEYGFGVYRLRDLAAGLPVALACLFAWLVAATPAPRRRRLAFVLACWWLVIVGGVAAADVAVTAWRKAAQGTRIEADPDLIWRRPAHTKMSGRYGFETADVSITFDERGFRNPAGLTGADVVFLGDSLTEALQVADEDTFVRRVEGAIGRPVASLAMTAYGPQQELGVLRAHAPSYRPRVVVWQLFEGNDWADALRFREWRRGAWRLDSEWARRYVEASPVARALARTLRSPGASLRYVDGTTARFRLRVGACPTGEDLDVAREEVRRALSEGAGFARARDLRLLVLLVPNARRVLQKWLTAEPSGPALAAFPTACDGFIDEALDLCRALEVECLDLTAPLRKRARLDNRRLYFPWDQHLDVAGHEVVADAVTAALQPHLR